MSEYEIIKALTKSERSDLWEDMIANKVSEIEYLETIRLIKIANFSEYKL